MIGALCSRLGLAVPLLLVGCYHETYRHLSMDFNIKNGRFPSRNKAPKRPSGGRVYSGKQRRYAGVVSAGLARAPEPLSPCRLSQ